MENPPVGRNVLNVRLILKSVIVSAVVTTASENKQIKR